MTENPSPLRKLLAFGASLCWFVSGIMLMIGLKPGPWTRGDIFAIVFALFAAISGVWTLRFLLRLPAHL